MTKQIGLVFGAGVAVASVVTDFTVELTDLAAIMWSASTGGSPGLQQVAYDDLHARSTQALLDTAQAELSLAATGSGAGILGAFGKDLYGTLESGVPAVTLQSLNFLSSAVQIMSHVSDEYQAAVSASAQQLLSPFSTITQGFAQLVGQVNISNSNGSASSQTGVDLSSNGISFDTLADQNGNYDLLVPLQAQGFSYGNSTLIAWDPNSLVQLASAVLDLNGMNTATATQAPTLSSTCFDDDDDGDDPDCD